VSSFRLVVIYLRLIGVIFLWELTISDVKCHNMRSEGQLPVWMRFRRWLLLFVAVYRGWVIKLQSKI
jgi:hypothetical protein